MLPHTSLLGLVNDPMSFADANLVLIASFRNVAELLLEDVVSRRGLLLTRLQLKGCPWRRAEGGDHIHRWLYARLCEGDGRLALHACVC